MFPFGVWWCTFADANRGFGGKAKQERAWRPLKFLENACLGVLINCSKFKACTGVTRRGLIPLLADMHVGSRPARAANALGGSQVSSFARLSAAAAAAAPVGAEESIRPFGFADNTSQQSEPGISEENLDDLHLECWRLFALYSLKGNLKSIDTIQMKQFELFVRACKLPVEAEGLASQDLHAVFRHVGKEGGHTHHLTFSTFLKGLEEVARRAFAEKSAIFGVKIMGKDQAFGRLMYDHILPHVAEHDRLPHGLDEEEGELFLESSPSIAVLSDYVSPLFKLFTALCGGKQQFMLHDQYQVRTGSTRLVLF
jgi:hypothetical protein